MECFFCYLRGSQQEKRCASWVPQKQGRDAPKRDDLSFSMTGNLRGGGVLEPIGKPRMGLDSFAKGQGGRRGSRPWKKWFKGLRFLWICCPNLAGSLGRVFFRSFFRKPSRWFPSKESARPHSNTQSFPAWCVRESQSCSLAKFPKC